MNTLKNLLMGFASAILLTLSLNATAFAQDPSNPLLDNRFNPLPLARVANESIESIAKAPDFHQMNRRPALVLFFDSKGDPDDVEAAAAAINMLSLTSLQFIYQADFYTVDNSVHPEIFAAYNQGVAVSMKKPVWLRIVPPADASMVQVESAGPAPKAHGLDVEVYNEARNPMMTQRMLENWLIKTPYVKLAPTQFAAPMLPFTLDKGTDAVTMKVPHLGEQGWLDGSGLLDVVVLFYPEVKDDNRGVYRAITLSGIEAFRLERKPMVFVAPIDLLDSYLKLKLPHVQPGEPELVVLRLNAAGKVVSATSYDPATTFRGDAKKAGTQTSDLSETDMEAFIAAACQLPIVDQTSYLNLGAVNEIANKLRPASQTKPSLMPNGPRTASVVRTTETQEANNTLLKP